MLIFSVSFQLYQMPTMGQAPGGDIAFLARSGHEDRSRGWGPFVTSDVEKTDLANGWPCRCWPRHAMRECPPAATPTCAHKVGRPVSLQVQCIGYSSAPVAPAWDACIAATPPRLATHRHMTVRCRSAASCFTVLQHPIPQDHFSWAIWATNKSRSPHTGPANRDRRQQHDAVARLLEANPHQIWIARCLLSLLLRSGI